MIKYFTLLVPILFLGCQPSSATKEAAHTPKTHQVEDKAALSHGYMKEGLSIEEADREFHRNDCVGYRDFYHIDASVLPCEDDDSVHYINDHGKFSFFGEVDSEVYFGYRKDEESIYYRDKVNISIWFWDKHESLSDLTISGVSTDNVLANSCASIFRWNYKRKNWRQDPDIFTCDSAVTRTITGSDGSSVSVSYRWHYSHGDPDKTISSIIAKEEAFKIKGSIWKADSIEHRATIREGKLSLSVPTPSLRKDMFRSYLKVKNSEAARITGGSSAG